MKIYIVGAGSIGKALAVFLKLAGQQVILLRATIEAPPHIQQLTVSMPGGVVHTADIEVSAVTADTAVDGIIVLTNKSFGNTTLASKLNGMTGSSPIVLLQNGLGVEQPFIEKGFSHVYRCVLFVTAQSIDDNTVRFKPVTVCPIGIVRGHPATLTDMVQQLTTPQFQFSAEQDIQPVIWEKAIANSVFNSVCPLLEADNGIFHRDEAALAIARNIISECVAVASLKGVMLHASDVESTLLRISRLSDGQLISTLQDIRNGRPTEIETLNGAIADMADQLGRSELVPGTRLLGELTKIKADMNQAKLHDPAK